MSVSEASLRGSSCTGQGFEEAVAKAMDRMGFRVESNVLLNSATGFRADHNLKQRWVRYILAKEHGRGNVEPWKQKFPGTEPIRRDWERRPPVTEVDVTATLDPQAKPPGDQFCGFTCDFKSLTVRTFRERLQGRDWPGSTRTNNGKPPAGLYYFFFAPPSPGQYHYYFSSLLSGDH